jgi:N-acetylglucosaminyldiphosphoundecaprenol N-acetyl-beta-D-mannosaminyltransferase
MGMTRSSGAEPPIAAPVRVDLFGAWVEAWTGETLLARIRAAVSERERIIIGNHNLHSLALLHRTPEMRRFYERADHIHVDGMPLIWWGRAMGHAVGAQNRITYIDWLPALLDEACRSGWRLFYLGSRPEVVEVGANALRHRHPGLKLETHHGYFEAAPGSPESHAVVNRINEAAPDLLMVGMGMPRQETWILQNADRLRVPVILPAGAALDYVAGAIPTPPRWLGRIGLEWAYRLFSEPRRLAHRYLVEPWQLVPYAGRDLRDRLRGRRG